MLASSLLVLASAVCTLALPTKRDNCVATSTGVLTIVDPRPEAYNPELALTPISDANLKPYLQRAYEHQEFTIENCENFVRVSAEFQGTRGCLTVENGLGLVTLQDCDRAQLEQGWTIDGENAIHFLGNEKGYHTAFGYLHGNQVVSQINEVPWPVEYTIYFTPN